MKLLRRYRRDPSLASPTEVRELCFLGYISAVDGSLTSLGVSRLQLPEGLVLVRELREGEELVRGADRYRVVTRRDSEGRTVVKRVARWWSRPRPVRIGGWTPA